MSKINEIISNKKIIVEHTARIKLKLFHFSSILVLNSSICFVEIDSKLVLSNFSFKGIEPKTKQNIEITKSDLDKEQSKNDVTKMAKNATDLGDDLT